MTGEPCDHRGTPATGTVLEAPICEQCAPDDARALACFREAVEWFHTRLDDPICDHGPDGNHPERPDTAREYFCDWRGWTPETIEAKRLGWAPPVDGGRDAPNLLRHLRQAGFSDPTILQTGLFTADLLPLWQGRYVFPYFDANGEPVYATARVTGGERGGADGGEGHPADFMSGKYAKPAHTKEYVSLAEPIYGLDTLRPGEPVLITEGMPDAVSAHEAGYACLSPVTRQFKTSDHKPLLDALDAHDVERVYVVQDAEEATSDHVDERAGWRALSHPQRSSGLAGALSTAALLAEHGVDARVGDLPSPSADKVDLDDYLTRWDGDLAPVLASARPPTQHPAYDPTKDAPRGSTSGGEPQGSQRGRGAGPSAGGVRDGIEWDGDPPALYDLTLEDVTGLDPGYRGPNPLGHHGDSENYYVLSPDGETAHDFKYGVTYNALTHILVEAGERHPSDPEGALSAQEKRIAWDHASEAGYIPADASPPNGSTTADAAHLATLPDTLELPVQTTGWNWRRAGTVDDPVEQARERTTDAIADALGSGDDTLLEAIPTLGKSYGAIAAAARTGEPVTILTTRGRKEQYDQISRWALDKGLNPYTIPAFTYHCDTANGEYGAEWRERVMDWYHRGATPKEIHKYAESELGHPIPCEQDEHTCPYKQRWDFDPDEYDVLIGHYVHAHKRKVTAGRTVIVDEFPEGAYETRLDHGLEGAVTHFLQSHDALPFDDYTDLIEGRHDEQRRLEALQWFQDHDLDRDGQQVFDDSAGHAAAPQAVYTILAGASKHLGNGWERAPFGDGSRVGLFNREQGRVWLLTPPEFDAARGLLGLDGTPTKELWDLTIGTHLDHRLVLDDDERREYLTEGLDLQFVRTTDFIKPYNNPDHVALDRDAALVDAIREQHGERPDLITTTAALDEYDSAGLLDDVDETGYYGNILGSNEFADSRLGLVTGSNHYGDGYVKKWAAYAGATADRGDEKGAGLTYGAFGDQVLTHMREHDTLQAALRFGRDGNGAVVYVHTDTLPDWVPLAGEGHVLSTRSDGMRQVIEAATGLEEWTTAELAAHSDVEIGERQVRAHLTTLVEERGVLTRETEGCGYVWMDDGLHRVGEHGDVELDPVKLTDLGDEESAELARSSNYTWEFRTLSASPLGSAAGRGATSGVPADVGANGGEPPPDEGE